MDVVETSLLVKFDGLLAVEQTDHCPVEHLEPVGQHLMDHVTIVNHEKVDRMISSYASSNKVLFDL